MKSLKAKIVSTCISIGFVTTLIGLAVSSYAWYSANKQVTGTGMNLKVEVDTNLVDINFKLYKYNADTKEGTEYIEGKEGFDLKLNKYDNFIRERNTYNSNILRFNVSLPNAKGSEESYRKIAISARLNATVEGSDFNGGFKDEVKRTHVDTTGYQYKNAAKDKNYLCNNISNIIYFKGFAYSYVLNNQTYKVDDQISIDETTATSIYEDTTDVFAGITEKATFVTSSGKQNEIQFYLENINSKASSVVFYVEYNYNGSLIDSFLANTEIVGSQDTSMMASTIEFQKDIDRIIISSQEVSND